jgi:hypothetical protein
MRKAAPIDHHPELNRHPRYLGLPETYFYSLTALAVLLLLAGGFRPGVAILAAALYVVGTAYLGRLSERHLDLPYRRLHAKFRPAFVPPFSQLTVRG